MSLEVKWSSVVLDAKDPKALMDFYSGFLGWEIGGVFEEYVFLKHPNGGPGLGAQLVPTWKRPVWPPEEGQPDQGAHCDFQVSDLAAAVELAERLGAVKASSQFIEGLVVMIDPEGHPFCLFTGE